MSGDLQDDLAYMLWQLQHRLKRRIESELAPLRLTIPQFATLAHLVSDDGPSAAEVARLLHLTPQAVSLLTLRLEAAGYLTREEPTAGRSQPLRITATGRRTLAAARAALDRAEQDVFAPLNTGDRATLHRLLEECLRDTGAVMINSMSRSLAAAQE
ncbi:MAG TPA: MarR family winged helix-turn-helix transcriptional regulator [Pseudonocardiaceae bacterium]|jgi:DNA-binding MarR family transcriptional regulator